MSTPEVRRGGLGVWAPSTMPPIGVDLTDEQKMAIAFRHLADIGFAENMAGHITWQPDEQTGPDGRSDKPRSEMYVNPWGLWWQELTASDICVVDEDAHELSGWDQVQSAWAQATSTARKTARALFTDSLYS